MVLVVDGSEDEVGGNDGVLVEDEVVSGVVCGDSSDKQVRMGVFEGVKWLIGGRSRG